MGFFTSKKVFTTSDQINKALLSVASLDYSQRDQVALKLKAELDNGGVSTEEFKEAIKQMRRQGEISEIDKNNLLSLLSE